MSRESALAFVQKTSTDTMVQNRVAALGPNDAAGLLKIAASEGYSLSLDDLKGVFSGAAAEAEIDDHGLGQISGGLNPQPLPPRIGQSFLRLNPGLLRGIIFVGGH